MNTNNTVRPVDSINIVTVVTDETQVNVTRPVTNVVRVVGPGPIGPVGPQGIQGETGLTVTDLFVARGNDTWSTTGSLQISASLIVSQSVVGLSGFTGSLLGTAATASYFAGYGNSTVLINQHETYNTFTQSIQTQVDGLSNATSSYVLNNVTASMLQPYVLTSVTQSMLRPYVLTSVTSSMLQPYVLTSVTASMLQPYVLTSVTSSMIVSGALSALSASFVNTLKQQVVITGSLNVSGSVYIPALTNDGQLYVLTYNTESGQVYYTGSTSIGGVPQGNVGQIQYNNNSLLGGVPTLIYTDSLLKATGSFSGSFNGSGSGNFNGTFIGNFTGSLLGTAATASFITSSNVLGPHSFNSILSASYAVTASYVTGSIFNSTNLALSASYTLTSSYINTLTQDVIISGSVFISGSTSQTGNINVIGDQTINGNVILSGSNVITGSSILIGQSQITGSVNVSGSVHITGSLTADLVYLTGSLLGTSATASFVTSSNVQGPHGMNSILSASYALTSSYVNVLTQDVTISGSLFISGSTTQTGDVTLQGNHIQNGTAILSGSNIITGSLLLTGNASITGSIYLAYPTTSSIYFSGSTATNVGRLTWNENDGTLDLGLKGGNVTLQIGQEEVARVVNKTGADLLESEYKVVRISGAQGSRIEVALAKGDGDANSLDTLGLVTETILNNETGFVTTKGLVRGIDTRGTLQSETWNEGDSLYLSPTIFGGVTNIPPIAPSHSVRLGYVVQSSPNGSIFVKVDNGYEIDELHNVRINTQSLSYGDLLMYDTQVWYNTKQLTGSYGLTGSLNVTGSTRIIGSSVISGSMTVTGSLYADFAYLTGSLLGTAATASFVTSSNVQGPYGMNSVISASHAVTVRSYAQLIGDGSTSNITVNHGLGTNDLHITVYSASGNFENIIPDIHRTSVDAIEVRFVNPPGLNQYRVYISV